MFGSAHPMYLEIKILTTDRNLGVFHNNKEWSINEVVAKPLFDHFGKPEIDLFASHLNSKCTKYASYKPDPDAYHVNVFILLFQP